MEYQRQHSKIRLNHSNSLPKKIIAYDAETFRTEIDASRLVASHTFRLGVAITSEYRNGSQANVYSYRITTPKDLWDIICRYTSPTHTTWLVGHNILFDFMVSELTVRFERGELIIDWPRTKRKRERNNPDDPHCQGLAIIDSPPTIIACRVGPTQGRLVIIDTLNWFQCSLSEIGKYLGLEKLPFPEWKDDDEKWFAYCHRDAEITWRCFCELMQFVKVNRFGLFKYTAAGQSMHAYRHRFMTHDIFPHDNKPIRQLERSGYFGGRVDVFRIGPIDERIHQLDVNSLFPSVMKNGRFPYVLHKYHIQKTFTRVLPIIEWTNAMANVVIKTDEAIYPIRTDNGVCYPHGRFETVLCGAELSDAYEKGRIAGIRSWAEYRTTALFTQWVSELWQLRQHYKNQGNTIFEQLTKRLMNSLYGKFAQRSPLWENCPTNKRYLPWTRHYECNASTKEKAEYRMFGWQCQKRRPWLPVNPPTEQEGENPTVEQAINNGEIDGTFIAISAFVTAAARMRMNELRRIAHRGNVIYQATDSLFVRQEGYNNLCMAGEVSQTELGRMRECAVVDRGHIYGCNDYILGGKIVISGKAKAIEIAEGQAINQRKFFTNGLLFNGAAVTNVLEKDIPWERQHEYTKGTVQSDNWTTPIYLERPDDYSDYAVGTEESISAARVSAND